MNLHSLVAGAIAAINPPVVATWRKSNGYTKNAEYQQVPAYIDTTGVQVQMQALSGKETERLNGLNIQGVLRSVHVNGQVAAVSRTLQEGGDVFVVGSQTWLVVQVLESWPDWSRVAVCLQ